jgi:hypothetical protein
VYVCFVLYTLFILLAYVCACLPIVSSKVQVIFITLSNIYIYRKRDVRLECFHYDMYIYKNSYLHIHNGIGSYLGIAGIWWKVESGALCCQERL